VIPVHCRYLEGIAKVGCVGLLDVVTLRKCTKLYRLDTGENGLKQKEKQIIFKFINARQVAINVMSSAHGL
jgi:hypothetical protein